MTKTALLIGVPEYAHESIPPIPAATHDVQSLSVALTKVGFTIITLPTGKNTPSRSEINHKIRNLIRKASKGDWLIIYFSGHGLHIHGEDYLVPADAHVDDIDDVRDYLVATNVSEALSLSRAECIVFIIDACREGITLQTKAALHSWTKAQRVTASNRKFWKVYSCSAGQYSRYIETGDAPQSLFTTALVEVIVDSESEVMATADQHPDLKTRYGVLIAATQRKLDMLCATHNKPTQNIVVLSERREGLDWIRPLTSATPQGTAELQRPQRKRPGIILAIVSSLVVTGGVAAVVIPPLLKGAPPVEKKMTEPIHREDAPPPLSPIEDVEATNPFMSVASARFKAEVHQMTWREYTKLVPSVKRTDISMEAQVSRNDAMLACRVLSAHLPTISQYNKLVTTHFNLATKDEWTQDTVKDSNGSDMWITINSRLHKVQRDPESTGAFAFRCVQGVE